MHWSVVKCFRISYYRLIGKSLKQLCPFWVITICLSYYRLICKGLTQSWPFWVISSTVHTRILVGGCGKIVIGVVGSEIWIWNILVLLYFLNLCLKGCWKKVKFYKEDIFPRSYNVNFTVKDKINWMFKTIPCNLLPFFHPKTIYF